MNKHLQNSGVRAHASLGEIRRCRVSENGMRQVLLNLIPNSVQAMPRSGEIRVSTRCRSTERVVLAISDTSEGIPPDRRLGLDRQRLDRKIEEYRRR